MLRAAARQWLAARRHTPRKVVSEHIEPTRAALAATSVKARFNASNSA